MNIINYYFKQLKEYSTGFFNAIDIVFCTVMLGASPANYKLFGFEKLSFENRKTFVTNRISRKMIKKYNLPTMVDEFENKAKFATNFSPFFGRKWILINDNHIDELKKFFAGGGRYICKPVNGSQGQNIDVISDFKSNDINQYEKILSKYKNYIIEEWIEQHEDISLLYPDAVNCLRLITVFQDDEMHILTGGLTLGVDSEIANGSQKSIICPVNLKTGILDDPGADANGNIFYEHPITKKKIVGFKIPFWDEIVMLLDKATKIIPQIGYVGWDIAITPNGPILIEGNTTPGYKYYQLPAHKEKGIGNLSIYKKFL